MDLAPIHHKISMDKNSCWYMLSDMVCSTPKCVYFADKTSNFAVLQPISKIDQYFSKVLKCCTLFFENKPPIFFTQFLFSLYFYLSNCVIYSILICLNKEMRTNCDLWQAVGNKRINLKLRFYYILAQYWFIL